MADISVPVVVEVSLASGATVEVELSASPTIEAEIASEGPQGAQGEPGPQGDKGEPGTLDSVTATVDEGTGVPGVTVTYDGANAAFAFHNLKGETGAQGVPGQDGQDGQDGAPGQDGADGVSPGVTITDITGGHRVTITDAAHPIGQSFDVLDGDDAEVTAAKIAAALGYTPADAAGVVKLSSSGAQTIVSNAAAGLSLKNGYAPDHAAYIGFASLTDGALGYIGFDGQNNPVIVENDGTTKKGIAGKSTAATATLSAASWVGASAPYTYTLSVSGVTATSAVEILPGASITAEQLEALQGANIQDGGQSAGSITLKAFGDKPSISLPIRILVRGDL